MDRRCARAAQRQPGGEDREMPWHGRTIHRDVLLQYQFTDAAARRRVYPGVRRPPDSCRWPDRIGAHRNPQDAAAFGDGMTNSGDVEGPAIQQFSATAGHDAPGLSASANGSGWRTGESAAAFQEAVLHMGGKRAVLDRGSGGVFVHAHPLTAGIFQCRVLFFGVAEFFSLVRFDLGSWEPTECPLCAKQIPINPDVGKGREFLSKQ